jgi:hypothetical protein
MRTANPTAALDIVIARYERRLDTIKRVREIVGQDPELASEIVRALQSEPSGNGHAPKMRRRSNGSPTLLDRIVGHFQSTGNRWMATPKLIATLGVHRGAVSNCLHTHGGRFEQRDDPASRKVKQWRLAGNGGEP